MIENLALGQRVCFTHILGRHSRWDNEGRVTVRRWDPSPHQGEGVVFGKRTLSNGHVERVTESDGYGGSIYTHNQWFGVHYFTAYLVAFDLRQKHVLVLPEHLSLVDP